MLTVRQGFFGFRAFWLTAGLTAGAANWAMAIEPTAPPQFLQPVPRSNVVQTQAQVASPPAPQQLRTQQGGAPQSSTAPAPSNGPKSAVQLQLEALYEQNGRPLPAMPDPQIQRPQPQANPQSPTADKPSGTPVQPVAQSRSLPSPQNAQPPAGAESAKPEPKTWAEAQAQGAPRSTTAKKVPWIDQLNPFRKRAPNAPPEEPAEIHYNPRQAAAQAGMFGQPQMTPSPVAAPVPVATSGRPNYSQLFSQPQEFVPQGAPSPFPAPQGDPFVGGPMPIPPVAIAARPTPPSELPTLEGFGTPIAPAAPPSVAQPGAVAAGPVPAASLPVLDFSAPIPLAPEPAPIASATPLSSPSPALVPVQTAEAPSLVPSVGPTITPIPAPAPPAETPEGNPFTGLGLNDAVPASVASQAPIIIPAAPAPVPAVIVSPVAPAEEVFTVPVPLQAPMPPSGAIPELPVAPLTLPPVSGPQALTPNAAAPVAPTPQVQIVPGAIPQSLILGPPETTPKQPAETPAPILSQSPAATASVPEAVPPVAVVPPVAPTPPPAPGAQVATALAASQPVSLPAPPAEDGFFSEEEERAGDQKPAAAPVGRKPPALPATPVSVGTNTPATASATPQTPAMQTLLVPQATSEVRPPELPPVASAGFNATPEAVQPSLQPSLKPVPRTGEAPTGKMSLISARSGQTGLKGFCPVMLRDHRSLVDASPEHRSFYGKRVILLSSGEAKAVFESDPAKYAPAADGNDVIHLAQTGQELAGSLEFAVWYKGRLYMFATPQSLEAFMAAPGGHVVPD